MPSSELLHAHQVRPFRHVRLQRHSSLHYTKCEAIARIIFVYHMYSRFGTVYGILSSYGFPDMFSPLQESRLHLGRAIVAVVPAFQIGAGVAQGELSNL